jgi:hypothetical protein
MENSIFMDKSQLPKDAELRGALGDKYELWMEIRDRVFQKYPEGIEEWNFPGKKYGWSFRIKDKKRAIIYLLPRDRAIQAAFVFGGRALEAILKSDVSEQIKSDLEGAKFYAEGRGVRIPVPDRASLKDIYTLIDIKLAF